MMEIKLVFPDCSVLVTDPWRQTSSTCFVYGTTELNSGNIVINRYGQCDVNRVNMRNMADDRWKVEKLLMSVYVLCIASISLLRFSSNHQVLSKYCI
jgi:hypothetical protein